MPYDPKRLMEDHAHLVDAAQRVAALSWELAGQLMQLQMQATSRALRAAPQGGSPGAGMDVVGSPAAQPGFDAAAHFNEVLNVMTRYQQQVAQIATEQAATVQAMVNEMSSQVLGSPAGQSLGSLMTRPAQLFPVPAGATPPAAGIQGTPGGTAAAGG